MQQCGDRMQRLPTTVALLAALLVSSLTLVSRAEAFVYWTISETPPCDGLDCNGPPAIGRANLDGTGIDKRFIRFVGPVDTPTAVAVDGRYIY